MMIAYHAAFDLNWFHIISADFNHHPFWLASRDLIVSSFLLLVGVSLVLAQRAGISPKTVLAPDRARRRLRAAGNGRQLCGISKTFITFGILHCIVVSSILALAAGATAAHRVGIGVLLIVAGATIGPTLFDPAPFKGLPLFDLPWLNWVGLMTHQAGDRRLRAAVALVWRGAAGHRSRRVAARAAPRQLCSACRASLRDG